jgi:hypothetical protein
MGYKLEEVEKDVGLKNAKHFRYIKLYLIYYEKIRIA